MNSYNGESIYLVPRIRSTGSFGLWDRFIVPPDSFRGDRIPRDTAILILITVIVMTTIIMIMMMIDIVVRMLRMMMETTTAIITS